VANRLDLDRPAEVAVARVGKPMDHHIVKEVPKVVEGKFGKRAPADLAARLREIADAVDQGEIGDFIAIYTQGKDGDYTFVWATSLFDAVGLSAMLHADALRKMRE
jgi:hypothetical protein